ncbi:hypothetical protein FDA94_29205 [Herbidospora galbida]|uniref:Uncharacterized protein n=1 Tax=Herbidospora galbida TaxID=2575442 RepID=A0A4U3M9F1_9ACTN|nr:hypothetical protein [Herbidospora galbida]TKK84694.1 hypothetical protein FDA94_29205 [Herbidospora galbida]
MAATIGPDGRSITVRRGYIRNEDGKYKLNFLFNPGGLSTSYGLETNLSFNIMNAWDQRDQGRMRVLPNQHLNLSLLFDRTYEVYEGSIPKGVEIDMEVAKAVVGLYETVSGGTLSGSTTGIMLFAPVDIVLATTSPLKFFGVIESLSMNYTIFNYAQVPIRAQLDVGIKLMPKTVFNGAGVDTGGGGVLQPGVQSNPGGILDDLFILRTRRD